MMCTPRSAVARWHTALPDDAITRRFPLAYTAGRTPSVWQMA
jgi:hypothetical protein